MFSDCDFKNELSNINKSIRKFYDRDLEIRRACHYCRTDMDQNKCMLFQIYRQRVLNIELNKLLDEIENKKIEILNLQYDIDKFKCQREDIINEIKNLDEEIRIYNNNVIKIRANDFLRTTIGEENYLFFKNNRYIDILGTNNSIYRITHKGGITKIKMKVEKSLIDKIKDKIKDELSIDYETNKINETWEGKIRTGDYPLEDAIAIVYMNIIKDSDKFDRDKCCGSIFIRQFVYSNCDM